MPLYLIDQLPIIDDNHVICNRRSVDVHLSHRPSSDTMVLHGKDKALEYIAKSSIAFVGKITHVQRGISSVTMPPRDHYTVQFDHKDIRTLHGRVYDTMIDFDYSQLGEGILAATNDIHRGIRKAQVSIPTAGHLYVACLNDSTKEISYLIEINRFEADDIVRRLNIAADIRPKQQ